ncbi:MAG: glycosyltransferase [Lamprocystis purpurea]|jgi:glycosyltransferase involved in cell wall biosynthesis/SAM-dependent methyltransferase|uniref:glycosyltransferase n=1 Tax=Lamprocystis purpurea TaxID=61598 RepID=UPI0003777427|nr:glycosyltransferase [Lamprocystis purpurea]MBV5275601.1 glycosyltransferase [Lamprocystis purpurea]
MTSEKIKCVAVVLGMHRSGTSAMTRALSVFGVYLGDQLLPAQKDNEKGFWEDKDVNALNEELLKHLGSTWDSLGSDFEKRLAEESVVPFRQRAIELLRKKTSGIDWFGIKDPRLSRLMPFWKPVFAELDLDVRCILMIRNPLSVAASLVKRDGISKEKALYLWLLHTLSAVVETIGFPRTVVEFDRLMAEPESELHRVASDLGISERLDDSKLASFCSSFLDDSLRHTHYTLQDLNDDPIVPKFVTETFRILSLVAGDKLSIDSAEVSTVLRRYTNEFDLLYPAMRLMAEADTVIPQLRQKTSELTRQVDYFTREMAERNRQIAERDGQIATLIGKVSLQNKTLAECNIEISSLRAEVVDLAPLAAERAAMVSSTSWRITWPLRAVVGLLRGDPNYTARLGQILEPLRSATKRPQNAAVPSVPAAAEAQTDAQYRIVYVSGEAHTPGHYYRVECYAEAARALGALCSIMRIEDSENRLAEIASAHVLVIWRAVWSDQVAAVIGAARAAGARVVFDVDDLMIDPVFARAKVIDGIRSQGLTEAAVTEFYARVRHTMLEADLCTVPTEELAHHVRRAGLPVLVLPNGFDEATFVASRSAARKRASTPSDGLLRVGYASGSRTHQRDFACCADALADVLGERPNVRLVLFRESQSGMPLVDLEEFPALARLEARVEWRDLVPIARLPEEVARFDINLAPLEVGNPFCEAKSELKYFEAALAGVCTIASPTGPFRRAIRHGRTGFLATTPNEWRAALTQLLDDPALRDSMARAARHEVLWTFGAERRAELMAFALDYLKGGRSAARAFASELQLRGQTVAAPPALPEYETVFASDRLGQAEVSVVVPVHNYAQFVVEALDSVAQQTVEDLDLIIVDDASTDESLDVVRVWAEQNASRFNRVLVLHNLVNAHLGPTRNVGFSVAETLYVLPLDADNRLLPDCLARCLRVIRSSRAAYAYPVIQKFGAGEGLMGEATYDVAKLVGGNYIDAMAVVSKAAWALVGGYNDVRFGWEDYDLWCRLAERGMLGVSVGGDPLAQYRVHSRSMLRMTTDVIENKQRLVEDIEQRHSWLAIVDPAVRPVEVEPCASLANDDERLNRLLAIVRCPQTGQSLECTSDGDLRTQDGSLRWPIVANRPVLFRGFTTPKIYASNHISNPLPAHVIDRIRATAGLVLNLSAGGTAERLPNVIEVEAAIFRHTDLVADAHCLPFADRVFDGVVALNAFEHYAEPIRAAAEIHRLLKPGGWVLIQTAFLQPEHEAPWHFYNCTKQGLLRWFEHFTVEQVHVSENFNPYHAIAWLASECETALRRDVNPVAADDFQTVQMGVLIAAWRDPGERRGPLWENFKSLAQSSQEAIAAGFELIGRKPDE